MKNEGKQIRKLACMICFFLMQHLVFSQDITVLNERKLNLGLDNMILVENHLAQNPNNENHLLLSGMLVDQQNTVNYGNYSAVSFNKGETWQNITKFSIPEGADPWGLITNKGAALTTVLGLEELFLFRSEDGGKNWGVNPINLGKAHDHQTIIEDTFRDIIYIVSIQGNSIYVNYSIDDGKSFDNAKRYTFSNLGSNTMTPVILSDGTLMVSFTTFNRPAIKGTRNGGKSEKLSKNLSWTVPYTIDNGFDTPLFISETCGTGFPVLVNNLNAEKYTNNMYYICSSQTEKSIVFHYSNTEGQSWSAGNALFPYTETETSKRNPFTGMPQLAINKNGVIGVIWQNRTENPDGKCQYLYFSTSEDGGENFSDPIKVSSQLSCMENKENGWAGLRYKSGGDYTGFSTDQNGDFIVIWPDSRNGISKLFMANIRVK